MSHIYQYVHVICILYLFCISTCVFVHIYSCLNFQNKIMTNQSPHTSVSSNIISCVCRKKWKDIQQVWGLCLLIQLRWFEKLKTEGVGKAVISFLFIIWIIIHNIIIWILWKRCESLKAYEIIDILIDIQFVMFRR